MVFNKVNGADVLGQKIIDVAELIRNTWKATDTEETNLNDASVTFLLWNSKTEQNVSSTSILYKHECVFV